MKNRKWMAGYFFIVSVAMIYMILLVYEVDPFMHYHAPRKDYFYRLDNERSQNNGIIRHFKYEGLITGSSMTENFKTSEAEELFGGRFIKVPFAGAPYREMGENIDLACKENKDLKIVIGCLDAFRFLDDKDTMRTDLGTYPTYLYDKNIFNDVSYIFNKDVLFKRIAPMREERAEGRAGGITGFDEYANWMPGQTFGKAEALEKREGKRFKRKAKEQSLTKEEVKGLKDNLQQNIVRVAKKHPDVTFYFYISPYSAVWWGKFNETGKVKRKVELERILIEELLKVKNIKLFSFNDRFDMTTDLNNYKDEYHYGDWINSEILWYMKNNKGLLTEGNYEAYLKNIYDFYRNYDYNSLFE